MWYEFLALVAGNDGLRQNPRRSPVAHNNTRPIFGTVLEERGGSTCSCLKLLGVSCDGTMDQVMRML